MGAIFSLLVSSTFDPVHGLYMPYADHRRFWRSWPKSLIREALIGCTYPDRSNMDDVRIDK